MVWSWYAIGAALLGAAACSFFFALAESALSAMGRWRAQQLAAISPEKGKRILPLFESSQDVLATIVLGNTLANGALIGITVWVLATRPFLPQAPVIIGLFLLILIGCEAIPKTLAVRAPEFWSLRVAGLMRVVVMVMRPFRQVAQRIIGLLFHWFIPASIGRLPEISEEEYPDLLEIAQQQGALAATEKELILQILSLDKRTARDVMKSRSQITCIPDDLSREEMLEAARRLKHQRLPVYDETPDTIIGILNARAFLLNPEAELDEVIEFPSYVPEAMNLLELLRSLQRQRRGMAIVLDEFGGTAGLVTMEDIVEELLGRFRRRYEREFLYERLEPGRWRVSGTCLVEEFRREYRELGEVQDVDTMGGLLVRLLEYVPVQGESLQFRGMRLTAQKVEERRVKELLVEVVKK